MQGTNVANIAKTITAQQQARLLLHTICQHKCDNPEALRAILEEKSETIVNLLEKPNNENLPPLYIAYLNGNKKVAEELLKQPKIGLEQFSSDYYNVNAKLESDKKPYTKRYPTLLLNPEREDSPRVPIHTGTFLHAGDTLLHVAIKNNDFNTFKALLKNANLNPNIENSYGRTPLTLAYSKRYINKKFLEELIQDERVNPNAGEQAILSQAVASADAKTVGMPKLPREIL